MSAIKIEGADELEKFLQTFPEKVERKLLRQALSSGGTVIKTAAKARAPRKSGTLRKAIAVRRVPRRLAVEVYVRAGRSEKNDGWYAHIIERGAKAHTIVPYKNRKKVLADGGKVFGKRVRHPGVRARPFMAPAINAAARQAVEKIGERLSVLIEREVKR